MNLHRPSIRFSRHPRRITRCFSILLRSLPLPAKVCQRINLDIVGVGNISGSRGYGGSSGTIRSKNLYDILGLTQQATQSEIKSKFYALSKLHHPDRNQGSISANNRFIELSHAYRILSNPQSKTVYDNSIQTHKVNNAIRQEGSRGPVGGREAVGLSRRRVNPQGPPPSYYRDVEGVRDNTRQTKSPQNTDFNWDEKYRQHYAYQQRFRKITNTQNNHRHRVISSNLLDFCLRAVAVGGCVLLAGALGVWFVPGSNH